MGDTCRLLRRRFTVGAASQNQPASRGRGHPVRLAGRFWRMLPSDFPPWQTVYGYSRRWRDNGTWQRIHRYLRQWVRLRNKRPQSPSVAIADTQSVPLGCFTHWARGFDGGKRVKGRKRHVLVDSMVLLLAVVVTAANIADQQGLPPLLQRLQFRRGWFRRLRLIWGDRAYWGDRLFEWVLEQFDCMLEVLERPRGQGFRVVPRRWVVERTLAWISQCRRLSQDDEKHPRTSETFIYLAMIQLMLKRVA